VAVYEGIIPVCHNEAGLAVVMSHEIAHAIARHGGERMSTDFQLKTVGGLVGNVFQQQSQMTRDMFMQAYGVGTNLGVVLPHSRKHELEADQIGVMLMARAGYDPNEAPKFWVRFGEVNRGSQPTEWMSTHPSDARRAGDLQAMMPQAMNEYNLAPHKLGLGEAL
jgi:predicted Zn-dependent protease